MVKELGYSIFDPQKIAVDYLSISYLDDKPNDNNIFNDNSIAKGDIVFNEKFNNNTNNWSQTKDDKIYFDISNGNYYFRA